MAPQRWASTFTQLELTFSDLNLAKSEVTRIWLIYYLHRVFMTLWIYVLLAFSEFHLLDLANALCQFCHIFSSPGRKVMRSGDALYTSEDK